MPAVPGSDFRGSGGLTQPQPRQHTGSSESTTCGCPFTRPSVRRQTLTTHTDKWTTGGLPPPLAQLRAPVSVRHKRLVCAAPPLPQRPRERSLYHEVPGIHKATSWSWRQPWLTRVTIASFRLHSVATLPTNQSRVSGQASSKAWLAYESSQCAVPFVGLLPHIRTPR